MSMVLRVLQCLAEPGDVEAAWARLHPALAALSFDGVIELDYRIALDDQEAAPTTVAVKRRVVEYLLQRKLAAFVYDCFDPFVNPWALEARMKALFWRIEYARSLSEQLEEIAEALQIPLGTVKSRLHNGIAALREDPRARRYFLS